MHKNSNWNSKKKRMLPKKYKYIKAHNKITKKDKTYYQKTIIEYKNTKITLQKALIVSSRNLDLNTSVQVDMKPNSAEGIHD